VRGKGAALTGRRIAHMPLGELRPHPRNPRTHKPAELRKSFNRFGYTNPILIDERTGLIAAGHGRYELLTQMHADGASPPEGVRTLVPDDPEHPDDIEWLVPVTRGWASRDDEEAMAYLIADNRQTELGGWDNPELHEMLTPLEAGDLGLAGTGFTPAAMAKLLEPAKPDPTSETENSYGERADNYRNKQLRSIIFDHPVEEYEYVIATAARARKTFGVETNAELFIAMLRQFESKHPA
jgi:hypothetical protein